MNTDALISRLRDICCEELPRPGLGATAERHRRLLEIGRENLSLARLAEAHFDAVAILAEDGRETLPNSIYGVWAAEVPGHTLKLSERNGQCSISGAKKFASGATVIDRALVTVEGPNPWLIDIDLRGCSDTLVFDTSVWKTLAFSSTKTATVEFKETPVEQANIIGTRGWYLSRPGFWHGACGPAACWAGGAIGLVAYALVQIRCDPHTLAHIGAMDADAWALRAILKTAGEEIDSAPEDVLAGQQRALKCRHLVEHLATDILTRFGRAYGPHPLAFEEEIGLRYQELTIYLRQCHAERDLAALGETIIAVGSKP